MPADDRIRLIHFDGQLEIGDKRNRGCEFARGEVIAHWDDDDVSAPGRLADQLQRLDESAKAVTGYRSMRFTDGRQWWLYVGSPGYIVGTSFCYRKDWWMKNRFPSIQEGEDNAFGDLARAAGEVTSVDAGDFMYATVHAGNTSTREFGTKNWLEVEAPDMRAFGVAA